MKGISTILATILIVIIVVALVSLTYTFATGLLGTATKGAESAATTATMNLNKRVFLVTDPTCEKTSEGWTITYTIRHDGATYNINYNEITALFGNDLLSSDWTSGYIEPGQAKTVVAKNTTVVDWSSKTRSFTVSAPAGSVYRTITCSS